MDTPDDRARITRISAENFRSIGKMDLELGDLTVLVGRNGAGKSNVLSVLRFVRDIVHKGFGRTLADWQGVQNIRRDGSQGFSIAVDVSGAGWVYRYELRLEGEEAQGRSETIHTRLDGEEEWVGLDSFEQNLTTASDQSLVYRAADFSAVAANLMPLTEDDQKHLGAYRVAGWALNDASFYDFEPGRLKEPQKSRVNALLAEDGNNLYAVLRGNLWWGAEERLAQALRSVVDDAVGFRVDALGSYLVGQVLYRAAGDGEPIVRDVSVESDGTVHLLAILGALYQEPGRPGSPTLVAIEEPGRNLHPGALAVLAGLVNEASLRMQVVLTTHSPDLIDHFDPSAIRVVERVDGATVVGRMEGPQIQVIKEKLFTTGEIMRVQGLIRDEDG